MVQLTVEALRFTEERFTEGVYEVYRRIGMCGMGVLLDSADGG